MRTTRELTEEELKWLTENYPRQTKHYCMAYLHLGFESIERIARQLGLKRASVIKKPGRVKPSQPFQSDAPVKKKKKEIFLDEDAPGGYCMDCKRYKDAICSRTGKEAGALWIKKCFKREA